MAKSPRTGHPRARKAAERRPAEQEPVTPGALSSTADDGRVAAAAEAAPQGRPTREEIARRAYELYVARGGTHGYDIEDWLQAERELRGR